MYGGQKNLKYKDRWRAICNANMWEEKLEEDIKAGLKIVKIENEGEQKNVKEKKGFRIGSI